MHSLFVLDFREIRASYYEREVVIMSNTHWYRTTRIEAYAQDLSTRKRLHVDVIEEEIALMATDWDIFKCHDLCAECPLVKDAYDEYVHNKN